MPQYAAVLGHQPHITIAELAASVAGFRLLSIEQKQVALFESADVLDPAMFDHLGGTVLLAERITDADVTMDDVPQLFAKEVASVKKKVTFSLRCFGIPRPQIKKAYHNGKQEMKRQERACRYIGNDKKHAATALLRDSGVLSGKKGVELLIIGKEDGLWVGKTIAAQDIDAYTWRDMEKPVRDTTVGLLPPKLAQVMLNFGAWMVESAKGPAPEAPSEDPPKRKRKRKVVYTVLDPFCGTGVIPLECLLRGWHVQGSDSAQKAVNGCKKNIDWMRKERKILKKDVSDTVWKQDATKPFDLKEFPDMVVTETSLGPSLEKAPSKRDAAKLKSDAEKLQAAFLKNAAETLPGVPLVCTWPFWKLKDQEVRLEKIWDHLAKLGYQATLPAGVDIAGPARMSLLYQRKDQFVGREIVLLLPKAQ